MTCKKMGGTGRDQFQFISLRLIGPEQTHTVPIGIAARPIAAFASKNETIRIFRETMPPPKKNTIAWIRCR
jgi:hypothetical protein